MLRVESKLGPGRVRTSNDNERATADRAEQLSFGRRYLPIPLAEAWVLYVER